MSDKLKELTEKLYAEGLNKGKEEGERILAEANSKAAETIAAAKLEAERIIAAATKEAEDLRSKTESDLKMASSQCLQATKKDIENVLIAAISDAKVSSSLADSAFIKEIISSVATAFSTSESKDIALVLPETLRAELEPWVASELGKTLKAGVKADFSKKISGGFTIGPADGSWFVSLTDDTFKALISEYLRPVTKKLLFG